MDSPFGQQWRRTITLDQILSQPRWRCWQWTTCRNAKGPGDVRSFLTDADRVGYIADIRCRPIEQREFNTDLVDLKDLHSETNRGRDQRITVTSIWERAKFTRAVWSLAFSYEPGQTPRRSNQWHLESNGWYVDPSLSQEIDLKLMTVHLQLAKSHCSGRSWLRPSD